MTTEGTASPDARELAKRLRFATCQKPGCPDSVCASNQAAADALVRLAAMEERAKDLLQSARDEGGMAETIDACHFILEAAASIREEQPR